MPPESRLSKIRFINLVKRHPCLYNTFIPEYSDRQRVDRAWTEIAKLTNQSVDKVKMKWKNLRRIYVRGLRPRTNGHYKPAPDYVQKHLDFIRPYIKHHIINQSNQFLYDDLQEIPETINDIILKTSRKQNEEHYETPRFLADECHQRADSPTENQPVENSDNGESLLSTSADDVDPSRKLFLLSLLPEIESMTPNQYRIFRMKAIEAVDFATSDVNASSLRFTTVSCSSSTPNDILRVSDVQTLPIVKQESDIDFSM